MLLYITAQAQIATDSIKTRYIFEQQPIDIIVLGDIDSDRLLDTAFIYTPPVLSSYDEKDELMYIFGCKDNDCYNRVTFSCRMPDLLFTDSVWGKVAAVDDIDGDGFKELLFNTSWFTGTTSGLYLYHFNGKEWEAIESVIIRGRLYYEEDGDEPTPVSNYFYKKGKRYYLKGITLKEGDEVPEIKRIDLIKKKIELKNQ